ncbi:hypothetical protein LIER_28524 [Lithospermum erythrorhizon]|uniref:DNA helicase n=1 Tax=Lithospermum erythrorhizon TaxID=34254 RepID=A0AAV3RG01_LITER
MRSRNDPAFVDFLMRVGNGEEPTNERDEIEIPRPMLIRYTSMDESIEELISYVYLDLSLFQSSPFKMMQHIILCPKNNFVDDTIQNLFREFQEMKWYISAKIEPRTQLIKVTMSII